MVNFTGSLLGLITLLTWCTGTISVKPTHELVTSYASKTLLDAFQFITADDPNGGYVDYVDRSYARKRALAFPVCSRDGAYFQADYMRQLGDDAKGRKSVWLESQFTFGPGMLMIARFASMPDRKCGTWPSFYTINKQESAHFTEVDLYEGANLDDRSEMTVWVGEGAGCNSLVDDVHFRKDGGAVRSSWLYDDQDFSHLYGAFWPYDITLVMSVEHDNIRAWRFGKGQEPAEIRRQDTLLDTGLWSAPVIEYNSTMSGCNVGQVFSNQTVALKINFCGSKAGGVGWERSGCAARTGMSCEQWIRFHPDELANTYFQVEYVKLFKAI